MEWRGPSFDARKTSRNNDMEKMLNDLGEKWAMEREMEAEANRKFIEDLMRSMTGSIKTHFFKASNTTWMWMNKQMVKIDQNLEEVNKEAKNYATKQVLRN
jgi:hypothetical protein